MIRPYRQADGDAVALLFTESVHHLACGYYDPIQLAAWAPRPPDLNGWMVRLASLTTLVAEIDAKLAGFISYEQNGHIDLLFTSPSHARHGLASALYRPAEAALVFLGISELITEASKAARPFFESHGFRIAEEEDVQLRGAEFRRYRMRKTIIAQ